MKCLFCGKELALLKRLTNGDDFCSEAHRRSYQNQFNELALGRLRHVQQVQQRFVAKELARDEYGEVGVLADGDPDGVGSEFPGASFVIDIFDPFWPEESQPQGWNPAEVVKLMLSLPSREFSGTVQGSGMNTAVPAANSVRWIMAERPIHYHPVPRGQALEARDVSRAAVVPVLRPDAFLHQREVFVPVAHHEECEVEIEPRSPVPAKPWRARGPGFEQLDATLGGWTRLDSAPFGSQDWAPSQPATAKPAPSSRSSAEDSARVTANLATLGLTVSGSGESLEASTAKTEKAPTEPERVVKPVPVTLHGVGPTPAQPAMVALGASRNSEPRVPVAGALPLRPVMLVGPAGTPANTAEAPQPAARVNQNVAQPAARVNQNVAQPAARVGQDVRQPAPAKPNPQTAAAAFTEVKPERETKPPAAAPAPQPVAEEMPQRKAASKVRRDVRIVPTQPVGRNATREAVDERPVPVPSPAVKPQEKPPEPAAKAAQPPRPTHMFVPEVTPGQAPIQAIQSTETETPALKLVPPEKGFAALSKNVKLALGVGAALALIVAGFLVSGGSGKKAPIDPNVIAGYDVGSPVVNMGWIENWAPTETGKRISVFKGSQQLSDYRVEFTAQIQTKAIGWMFRGMNPRNYYVAKIEALKPGLDPTVALVRYAVIDGKVEERKETILPFKTRAAMRYNIRFEAVRSRFTAWVNDQKIDEWRDTRIGSGSVGMYAEPGEAAVVDGIVSLTALIPK
ncbi:MAG: hypothetical protein ABI824_11940 [Acidobacteriota bacterium]